MHCWYTYLHTECAGAKEENTRDRAPVRRGKVQVGTPGTPRFVYSNDARRLKRIFRVVRHLLSGRRLRVTQPSLAQAFLFSNTSRKKPLGRHTGAPTSWILFRRSHIMVIYC